MSLAGSYWKEVEVQLNQIAAEHMGAIEAAGALFARALCEERWIYLFGTGHSHMLAEELFYRAGGLARVRPMLHSPLMLHESASESTDIERDVSQVEGLLKQYPMAAGDVLVVISNSGRNPVPVELAMQARTKNVAVITVYNRRHSAAFPSRHESGKKVPDVADIAIDNCGVVGDACVPVGEAGLKTGAASTVTGALIMQLMATSGIEQAMSQGWRPELFCSSNAGDEAHNEALLGRYRSRVRHL